MKYCWFNVNEHLILKDDVYAVQSNGQYVWQPIDSKFREGLLHFELP